MIQIDGSMGEGGGQIVRSSLTLSLLTEVPFHITRIRAGRPRPGLRAQHLTAVAAAAEISGAHVDGAELGGRDLTFRPGSARGGSYRFSVGTAGSTTLVLQTILLPLLLADEPSELVLEGGTHSPFAPPFDFFDRVFLPLLERMGAHVKARLVRPGFYPAGGGRLEVSVEPTGRLLPIDLLERGEVRGRRAVARISNLPRHIPERELAIVYGLLAWPERCLEIEEVRHADGPGNTLTLEIESDNITELFTGFGKRGVSAETVASRVVDEVREYLDSGAPVGRHLADQLLIPMAVAGRGSFSATTVTPHCATNAEVVGAFMDVRIDTSRKEYGTCKVEVAGSSP